MENKKQKIETREFIIEDELGNIIGDLSLISFVSAPAIEQDFKLFSNKFVFSKINDEKRIVIGPAMRAGVPILRQDSNGEYFNGVFSSNQIKKCSEIYLKNSNHLKTNIEHGELLSKNEIDGVQVVESWIVENPKNDKANELGFKEINKGDWYISFKIENKSFWNFLKENGGGFSIEGVFAEKFSSYFSKKEIEKTLKNITFDDKLSDEDKKEKIKKLINYRQKT